MKNPCGNCSECRRGTPKYCEDVEMLGLTVHGAAAEYMVADSAWLIHVPDNLSFEAVAPLMCAGNRQDWVFMNFFSQSFSLGCTIFCGLKTANLNPGDTVGIIGAGVRNDVHRPSQTDWFESFMSGIRSSRCSIR